MVHPKFDNMQSKVEDSLIISEGFVEVLGFELYNYLLRRAMSDEVFRESISEGFVPGPVPTPRPRSELGYGEAAQKAAHIMDKVGETRFTAAFFLGQPKLVGMD